MALFAPLLPCSRLRTPDSRLPKPRTLFGAAALLALAAFLLAPAARGDAAPEAHGLFFSANQAFRDNDFSRAAQDYETLARQGRAGADVFFNLGNAYFRMGRLGLAIVNYERARILAPRDPDVDYNLRHAQGMRTDEAEKPGDFPAMGWLAKITGREAFLAFAVLNALFFLVLTLRSFRSWEWTWYAAIGLAILWTAGAFAGGLKVYQAATDRRAVVVDDRIEVRAGPDEKETLLFVLHAGTVVDQEREEDGWRLVRFSEDKRGWTPDAGVAPVRPLFPENPPS